VVVPLTTRKSPTFAFIARSLPQTCETADFSIVRAVRTPSCARFELSGSGSDKVSPKSPGAPQKFSPRSCRCRRRTSPSTRCRKVLRSESAVAPAPQDTGQRRNTINEHSLQLSVDFRRLCTGFESP
jgi:hypothetical protein